MCHIQGFVLVVVFGSRAAGGAQPESDVDLAFQPKDRKWKGSLLDLLSSLDQIFERHFQIDPVILDSETDPVLRYQVFVHGVPLYEERGGLFVDESYRAWMLFHDTKFIRRMREQYLTTFVRQHGYGT